MDNEIVVGIDLGTTNSEIAVVREGKAFLIPVDHSKIMPSIVSIDSEGKILVGTPAENNELAAPDNTVRCIKRKMGQEELVAMEGKLFSAPMISSLILKRLKLAAEEFLNQSVVKAVITVPAFFNEKQREATKEAAELAGLDPLRLLNEPTAAALAYSVGSNLAGNVLIYDLGGGTFDVSIVSVSGKIMEVKASHGDVELGGSDFDLMIVEKVKTGFQEMHGIDLTANPLTFARVLRAAEKAKIRLSTEAIAHIVEEFIAEKDGVALHLKMQITRTEFDAMIRPSIEQTLVSVRKALEIASLSAGDLQKVILVGGATHIPLVPQMLEEELGIVPQHWVDPTLVVAIGASIEAANLAGQCVGPRMVDVTPHSLGIKCLDGQDCLKNMILIRRNTALPCSASRVFYKCYEEQETVVIEVYQGESEQLSNNRFLGKFSIEGVGNSTSRDIHVKFHLDRSGLLEVTATDVASGKQVSQVVRRLSHTRSKAVNTADLESVQIHVEPKEEESVFDSFDLIDGEVEEAAPDDQNIIDKARAVLNEADLTSADREELIQALTAASKGDTTAIKKLSELLYYLV